MSQGYSFAVKKKKQQQLKDLSYLPKYKQSVGQRKVTDLLHPQTPIHGPSLEYKVGNMGILKIVFLNFQVRGDPLKFSDGLSRFIHISY